jgi:hypothetical protein
MSDWLRAFALTTLIELAVVLPWMRRKEPKVSRRVGAVLLVNLATHPLVWFLFPGLLISYPTRVALSEVWAVLGEAAAYALIWPALGPWRAALLSLAANSGSFLIGLWIIRR